MEIILSVSYVIETGREEFWNPETGCLLPETEEAMQKSFPPKLILPCGHHGERSRLSYMPLGGISSEKCPLCQRWMTTKPAYHSALQLTKEVDGTRYCECCAYEVQVDIDCKK